MNEQILLSVQNLTITTQGETSISLVENASFAIDTGKTLGIVGESGSGKSLTALSVNGLLPPGVEIKNGMALLKINDDTINLYNLPEYHLKKIRGKYTGMIFQEPMTSLNPSMKCGIQAGEPMAIHGNRDKKEIKERVLTLFEEVKLPEPDRIFNAYPHQLSGGQRQRVMIATALANDPQLLIADEPTTALDVTVQKSIITLLRELQEKFKMSLLFISHDLGVIKEIAHDIIVMKEGKIVEKGKTNEILTHPRDPYTKGLIACRPSISGRKKRLPVIDDFVKKTPNTGNKDKSKRINPPPETNGEILLQIKNVKKLFVKQKNLLGNPVSYTPAVDNVSFSVKKGETVGLVGESGCGKTTLGRLILQLIRANQGEVIYNGISLYKLNARDLRNLRRKIQLIFQDPYSSLNPRLNIIQTLSEPLNVHFPGLTKDEIREKIIDILNKVSLREKDMFKYPHQFSGGQRQRIVIARALIINPEFVICDESVSALDVSLQAQVLNLLNDLKDEMKLTYLFISHDLSVIRHMADRILVMKEGKIVEKGKTDILFQSPETQYLKVLISSVPGID
ncbi:MAG: ABC transporter ATP-binding protein [Bacteroidota bacterium]